MEYVLRICDLSKRYKGQLVLDKVNINIARGDIYGFVGENGSGKTTVIRLVTGLIFENSGSFELFGVSSKSPEIINARKRLGAIVETPSIYLNMTARENLEIQCDILGISDKSRVPELLEAVGLADLYGSSKKSSNYSLGMRQRLGIAMALAGDPEFIILDEPMNGLDPAGIVEVRELILRLNRERGITFLISSHILNELALVATKYGIISKGRIVREITAEELHNESRGYLLIDTATRDGLDAIAAIVARDFGNDTQITSAGLRIYGSIEINRLLASILDAAIELRAINTCEAGIEEYYLNAIGGGANA